MSKLKEEEKLSVYFIPQNFMDTNTVMGGLFPLRNFIEGIAISAIPVILAVFLIHNWTAKLYTSIIFGLPLLFFGCVGIDGYSVSEYLITKWKFKKRKAMIKYNPRPKSAVKDVIKGELPNEKVMKLIKKITKIDDAQSNKEEQLLDASKMFFVDDIFEEVYKNIPDELPTAVKKKIKNEQKKEKQLAKINEKKLKKQFSDNKGNIFSLFSKNHSSQTTMSPNIKTGEIKIVKGKNTNMPIPIINTQETYTVAKQREYTPQKSQIKWEKYE